MSVDFSSNAQYPADRRVPEPCLCAQLAPGLSTGAITLAELRPHAYSDCGICGGSGVETVSVPIEGKWLNLNSANGAVVLALMGLDPEYGEASLADARRGLVRALNADLAAYVRKDVVEYGPPTVRDDGAVELRPFRMFSRGLTVQDIADRLARVRKFLDVAQQYGATKIHWG